MEINFLVFPHLGLGDQIIMNGYIHYLIQTQNPTSICIICYDNYQNKTLEHLYSDYPNVSFHRIEHPNGRFSPFISSLNGKPFRSVVNFNNKSYFLLNFGVHSQYNSATMPGNSWADSFYLQGALDPSHRFSHFRLPSNMRVADDLYERVIKKIGKEYILINDEPKSSRNINGTFLKMLLKKSGNTDLPVVYLGLDRYKYPLIQGLDNRDLSAELACYSLLDLWKVIQHAKECHFMDSSIACMTDLIKESTSNLNLHAYITHTVDPKHPIFINRKWSIWYEEDLSKKLCTVSVVIASYNRFDSLLDTIKSIQMQTYPVLEIIVVNDGSDDPRYKSVHIPGITMLHNEVNTKQIYGFPNISHVRNKGIRAAKGDYIAFCDDDDVWLPHKIEMQMARMMEDNTDFCSTDGFYCAAPWNSQELENELKHNFDSKYPKYNAEHYWNRLKDLFGGIREFPKVWTYPFVMRHNGIILSSVILHRKVLERVGMFHDLNMRENPEDYDLWKRVIQQFPMSYVETPCFGWAAYPYKYG